ncbi:hypothetical protein RMCBS344292_15919 [Rhizopus microsporus]|nr:hypothetical protein RMCBS344292_15919 [Rhizopus microsporus]
MNPEVDEKLAGLIKQITETGNWILDEKKLKLIKATCKKSDHYITVAFVHVMAQLHKNHSQIRYSSLQLIEQLFDRSKLFRELLTEDFPVFVQLVVGFNDRKLPPPPQIAAKLKQYALALIKNWYMKYGEIYRQISISFDFLMDNGYMNDNQASSSLSSIHADNINKANKSARIKALHLNRYELLKADVNDHLDIINDNLNTMDGCFDILVPKNILEGEDNIDFNALLRGDAVPKQHADDNYKDITIDLSESSLMEDVKETQDNSIIFDQLREAYTVLETKHTKQVNIWINTLIRLDIDDKAEKEALIKKLIDLKAKMTEASRKAKLLGIEVHQREIKSGQSTLDDLDERDDEFADEEFEEVDIRKEAADAREIKTNSSAKLPPLQRIFPLAYEPTMTEDPTYAGPIQNMSNDEVAKKDKGKQKAEEQRDVAPVVEWGDDLYYWDKEHVQFNTSGIDRIDLWVWVKVSMNYQIIYYKISEKELYIIDRKDQKRYLHPLHNGGLCPRRDLVTCPFHGKIIPRDELGRPLDSSSNNPKSPKEQSGSKTKNDNDQVMDNLWELLEEDVMKQSGQEKVPSSRKRQRKTLDQKSSSLIDIKKKPENSYSRLQRKLNSTKNKKLVEEAAEYEREMKSRNREANRWQ